MADMNMQTTEASHLRLVEAPIDSSCHDENEASSATPTLRMERRSTHRWPLRGHAKITELTPNRFGRTHEADLLDHCSTGLGLMCDEPLEPGTWVDLRFDGLGFPMQRGIVVRCQRCADGWRVSVQTEQRRAA